MKLKGKLILSCAALAAVATTAFSTTYAWYTSNTEVKATGITASTGTSNDSALQISLDGSTWGASVDLTTLLASAQTLTPVQRNAGATGVASTFTTQNLAGTTNPVSATAGDATRTANYVQFPLYFRNITIADSTTSDVYIKSATIVNQQAGGVDTKLLTDIGTHTQAANSKYKVDLLRALDLEIAASYTAAVGADEKVECDGNTVTTGEKTSLYNLEAYACKNAAGTTVKDTLSDLAANSWDALGYYNTVKGLTGADVAVRPAAADYVIPATGLDTVVNTANSKLGTIQSNKQILKTIWTLYLDGWDTACFDACKGQTITASFVFTTQIA